MFITVMMPRIRQLISRYDRIEACELASLARKMNHEVITSAIMLQNTGLLRITCSCPAAARLRTQRMISASSGSMIVAVLPDAGGTGGTGGAC